jgi:hypothetical protein
MNILTRFCALLSMGFTLSISIAGLRADEKSVLASWAYSASAEKLEWADGVAPVITYGRLKSDGLQLGPLRDMRTNTVKDVYASSLEEAEKWKNYIEYKLEAQTSGKKIVITGIELEGARWSEKTPTYRIAISYSADRSFHDSLVVLPATDIKVVPLTPAKADFEKAIQVPSDVAMFRIYFFESSYPAGWHGITNLKIFGEVR